MTEMKIEVLGFDDMRDSYGLDLDFSKPQRKCKEPIQDQLTTKWGEYFIQEGMLFKGIQLCIPKGPMRTNLIKEKHSSALAGHFGVDKTLNFL